MVGRAHPWNLKIMNTFLFFFLLLFSFQSLADDVLPCSDSSESESEIEVVKIVRPNYPTSPYTSVFNEGYVKIQIEINSHGQVDKAVVIDSKPKHYFDKSALHAIRKSLFSKDKDSNHRCGIFTYKFTLD
jgi:TonB family protein